MSWIRRFRFPREATCLMAGLFAIVGPSGAGKDTLMRAAAEADPRIKLVRRVITRPEDAGGEVFEGVSETEFERRRQAGAFVLHWRAHGLSYGIPATIRAALGEGRSVLFNGSRGALSQAVAAFPALQVVLVTARPDVLRTRLGARGRETSGEIEKRLVRAEIPPDYSGIMFEIDNSGDLGAARDRLLEIVSGGAVTPP